jgi:hypothetical protein
MSHVTNIDLEIRDLASLRAACKRLGWEFVEEQKTYRWYGRFVGDHPLPADTTVGELGHCDHAIKVPGAWYEVGVVRRGDAYVLRWDFWPSGGLNEPMGGQTGRVIKQAYGVEHSRRMLVEKGYRVLGETRLPNGSIKLRVGV